MLLSIAPDEWRERLRTAAPLKDSLNIQDEDQRSGADGKLRKNNMNGKGKASPQKGSKLIPVNPSELENILERGNRELLAVSIVIFAPRSSATAYLLPYGTEAGAPPA